MPRGDGTGPYGDGPLNESGRCEGRGRARRHAREPQDENRRMHARPANDGCLRGRRRIRDRQREDCRRPHHRPHRHGDHDQRDE